MIKKYINQFTQSGNLHSLAGNLFFAVFSLVTFLILVRVLDKALFGQWILFVTMASLFDMFRLGLTGTAAVRLMSRSNPESAKSISASSYTLGLAATVLVSILFLFGYLGVTKIFDSNSYYLYVLLFYPALALANLPFNQAIIIAQGKVNFKRIMVLRMVNGALILIVLCTYVILYEATFQGIILAYIGANFLSSLLTTVFAWDELKYLFRANKNTMKDILHFGKYSTASSVGSSLLRSSDTIILSMAPFLGPEAIAVYAIPLKFVEAVEIPLRSFSATAFPRLSKALKNGRSYFKEMLLRYTSWSTVILIPIVIALFSFPAFFLQLVGGSEYFEFLSVQKDILYLICIYILLLPLDRYSGVALFALDKPKLNFYKILLMLVANVIFDIVAIFVFQSLIYVALATLIFTLIGILTGWHMVLRETKIEIKNFSDFLIEKVAYYFILMKSWFYPVK